MSVHIHTEFIRRSWQTRSYELSSEWLVYTLVYKIQLCDWKDVHTCNIHIIRIHLVCVHINSETITTTKCDYLCIQKHIWTLWFDLYDLPNSNDACEQHSLTFALRCARLPTTHAQRGSTRSCCLSFDKRNYPSKCDHAKWNIYIYEGWVYHSHWYTQRQMI